MGLFFARRRPLVRGAMLAGGGYMAYRTGQRRQAEMDHEYEQDQAIANAQAVQAPAPPPPAPAAGAPASEADTVQALTDLKDLLDQGAISQAEFDAEKQKLLGG